MRNSPLHKCQIEGQLQRLVLHFVSKFPIWKQINQTNLQFNWQQREYVITD